jgi:hypothetical protein
LVLSPTRLCRYALFLKSTTFCDISYNSEGSWTAILNGKKRVLDFGGVADELGNDSSGVEKGYVSEGLTWLWTQRPITENWVKVTDKSGKVGWLKK